jgi:dienelactone hydrolase
MLKLLRLLACLLLLHALPALADEGPKQKEFLPPSGHGPALVLVSGQSGPSNYVELAKDMAAEGFYVVLVDGNDFWLKGGGGEGLLRGVIQRAQQSPNAVKGKVAVLGCSLGGGSAMAYAARMPDLVSAVVTHYPLTSYITDPAAFVGKIRVPTLMLAGTFDDYKSCCMIDMARKLADAAKAGPNPGLFQLVEYPGVDHGFSSDNSKRRDARGDSLKRTVEFLRKNAGA